jgi:hypothetical protein
MIVLKNRLPAGFQVCITLPARWEEAAPEGESEQNSQDVPPGTHSARPA